VKTVSAVSLTPVKNVLALGSDFETSESRKDYYNEKEKRRKGKKRNEEMAGRLERGSSILTLVMMGSVQLEKGIARKTHCT
jgi:hypothetical protein